MNFSNSSTIPYQLEPQLRETQIAEIVILTIMLCACLVGNILVLSVILSTKKLRTPANFLIANLAVCDVTCAILAIPFTLIIYNILYGHKSYPYGYIGCKFLWPMTTQASNGSVFTLVTISIERYVNTSSIRIVLTKKRIAYVVMVIHLLAFILVLPYISHLSYIVIEENAYCYEAWDEEWHQQYYTISLVLLQYVIPLFIMVTFYSLSWWRIYTRNREMIRMSEDYESKMTWRIEKKKRESMLADHKKNTSESKTCLIKSTSKEVATVEQNRPNETKPNDLVLDEVVRRGTIERIMQFHYESQRESSNNNNNSTKLRSFSLPGSLTRRASRDKRLSSMRFVETQKLIDTRHDSVGSSSIKEMKRFRRSEYRSQAAFVRHQQSVKTLKMFTVVVIVFAVFALPNQISWGLQIFDRIPPIVLDIFIVMTYVSSVVNCWIYGGFNKAIRDEYGRKLGLPCAASKLPPQRNKVEKRPSNGTSSTYSNSFYDTKQENVYLRRQSAFSRMFRDHLENFENFKHLYKDTKQENLEVNL